MILLPNFTQHPMEERILLIMKMKHISITGIILSLTLTAGVVTAFAAMPSDLHVAAAPAIQSVLNSDHAVSDKTLNGLFEAYTVAEYEQIVKRTEQYADKNSAGLAIMKDNLNRVKADNGKGEFVVYKPFLERETATTSSSINPIVIMAPEQDSLVFTKEEYSALIQNITQSLDEAIQEGKLTEQQKTMIPDKMNENLSKL